MSNKSKFFIPFAKVDKDKKMVYGYISTEIEDSQGEVVERKAIKKSWDDYMKWANIREMHQPSAVGVTKEFMHDKKGTWIGAKIVDKEAWEKVKEEVYKGFSIGGRVLKKVGNVIKAIELFEISIVDRPANPETVFEMVKRDSSEQKVESIIKIFDNVMKKELKKARRKKKEIEEAKEEKNKEENKEVEEEETKEETREEVEPTVENIGANKEKPTVENKEFKAEGIEDDKDDDEDEEEDSDEEEKEEEESGDENDEDEEEEEDDDDKEDEEEEKDEEDDEKEDEEEEQEESEDEKDKEDEEEEKAIEPSDVKKDVHEVVALSDVAGNLKWLSSAFENNKRPPAVIKLINKALDSVMSAISLEAKKDTKKVESSSDIVKIIEKKLGEIVEKITESNSAEVKELMKEVTSLKERFDKEPVGDRPRKVFTVEKGEEGGEGDDDPKDSATIKEEIGEIEKEIGKVHKVALTLVGTSNPDKESEIKEELAALGKKLSVKKEELRNCI